MKFNFKNIVCVIACAILLFGATPTKVSADSGPKPSVQIAFEGVGDEVCYATLLSKTPSTGPHSVWDGDPNNIQDSGLEYSVWSAFVNYKDSDGFYFLQVIWRVNGGKALSWNYYPPKTFKVLMYYPQSKTFVVSDIYEKYAFDSYFTVSLNGIDIESVKGEGATVSQKLKVTKSYQWGLEVVSLVARILITIAIEIAIAFLFGLKKRKQLLLLMGVNTITQILLNVFLNVVNYRSGPSTFITNYILIELAIIAIEAVLYCFLLKRISEVKKSNWFYVVYAISANLISFFGGLAVAFVVPGIF